MGGCGGWVMGMIVFRLLNITGNEISGVTGCVGWSVSSMKEWSSGD